MLNHHRRRRCATCPGSSEGGFTLTELLVAMMIVAIIIGPLSASFIAGYKTTQNVDDSLSNSFDSQLLARYWTSDVQSAETVNPDYATGNPRLSICGAVGASDYPLVTFQWDAVLDGRPLGTTKTRVSYVVEGDGRTSSLTRRVCTGPSLMVTGEEQIAAAYGVEGQAGNEMVYGADPLDPFRSVCPGAPVAYSCTVTVRGKVSYSLTVERRVPGPGSGGTGALPNPPASVSATPINRGATVTWPASVLGPDQAGVLAYQALAYADDPGNPAVCQSSTVPVVGGSPVGAVSYGTSVSSEGALTFTFEPPTHPLENNVAYCFRVRARNALGWGQPSVPSSIVFPVPGPPSTPLALAATGADKSIRITWTPNPNDGGFTLQSYRLTVSPNPTGVVSPLTVDPETTSVVLECPNACVTNGTEYTITLAGVNVRGVGPAAGPVKAKPYGPPGLVANGSARGGGADDLYGNTYYSGGIAYAEFFRLRSNGLNGGRLWGYRIEAAPGGGTEEAIYTYLEDGTLGTDATPPARALVGCRTTNETCLVNGRSYEIRIQALTTTTTGANCRLATAPCQIGPRPPNPLSNAEVPGRTFVTPSGPPAPPPNVRMDYAVDPNATHGPYALERGPDNQLLWTKASVLSRWLDTSVLSTLPAEDPPSPVAGGSYWNGAPVNRFQVFRRRAVQYSVTPTSQVPPDVDPNTNDEIEWSDWEEVSDSIGPDSQLTVDNLRGGYWYQFAVKAGNQGEWWKTNDPGRFRFGAMSPPATGTPQTTGQTYSNAVYVVTKPEKPDFELLVSDRTGGAPYDGCIWVHRSGENATALYGWESAGPHRNGVMGAGLLLRFLVEVTRPNGSVTSVVRNVVASSTGRQTLCDSTGLFKDPNRLRVRLAFEGSDAPSASLGTHVIGHYGNQSNVSFATTA